jgi:hypothetical protein
VQHHDEHVATDTGYSDAPKIDGGETCAQIFVGTETLMVPSFVGSETLMVTNVYGMKTEKQFVNTLEDNIPKRGAVVGISFIS